MSKAKNYARRNQPDRLEWAASQDQKCMWCSDTFRLQVHEIERKGHSRNNWAKRCNYLLLCQRCHMGPFDSMPHAKQLALKLVADPEHFSLEEWLLIRYPDGRAPNRVTMAEIEAYKRALFEEVRS